MPYILDIESSGLHKKDSYPIEIAWINSEDQDDFETFLIRPANYWNYWNKEAELVHKIAQHTLVHEGLTVFEAADFVVERLENKVVLSDCPEFDQMWLDCLFEAALVTSSITLNSVYGKMNNDMRMSFRNEINKLGRPHRALGDVNSISQVYNQFRLLGKI